MHQSISEKNNKSSDLKQSRKKSGGEIFIILFLIAFAIFFGALGAGIIHSAYTKEKTYSVAVEGRIIGYKDSSYNNKRRFSPVVEYWVGNQEVTGETNVQFNYRPFKEGEYVSVYYNPNKPDEFYIKEYDLKTMYKMGTVFLVISMGIFMALILFAILGKVKMDNEKKEQIQVKIILSLIILFMFTVFSCLIGIGITICIFGGMGIFISYGIYQDKHKNKKIK